MNRDINQVREYVRVSNDDPRLEGSPAGEVRVNGDYCYVREDDWIQLLAMVMRNKFGDEAARAFTQSVTH